VYSYSGALKILRNFIKFLKKGQGGKNKMTYNAKNAKEVVLGVPPDTILDGVITKVEDGHVKDFVLNTEKWLGDLNGPGINVTCETNYEDKPITSVKVFPYREGADGKTEYATGSNLAKFRGKYGKLPEVGDKVKLISNSKGFLNIKLD
jgi:hypothetical protein